MIKKQLGLLAGSVMVAATSNAAITLGSDTLAVFNTAGAGSYYQLVTGSTAAGLVAGTGFSVDISTAASSLGGTIDSFALFALDATGAGTFNYDEAIYVSAGGGLVFAGGSATSTTNGNAQNAIVNIQSFLNNANLGYNGEGTTGDADGNGFAAQYLVSNANGSIVFNEQTLTHSTNAQLLPGTISLSGSTLTYSGLGRPHRRPHQSHSLLREASLLQARPLPSQLNLAQTKPIAAYFLTIFLLTKTIASLMNSVQHP